MILGLITLVKYALTPLHTHTVNIQLLDYGEEYVLTFPYIYVRSVTVSYPQTATPFYQSYLSLLLPSRPPPLSLLPSRSVITIPWLELGGVCAITCRQSGYTANVEFHTKVRLNLTGKERDHLFYLPCPLDAAVLWWQETLDHC